MNKIVVFIQLGDQDCFIVIYLMITNVLSLSKIKIVVCTIDVAGQPISRDRLSCATQARFMFVIDGDKNSFTTHAGIWPSKSDIEIELKEKVILQKKNKFSTFQTAVERKGLGIILGEPSVSLRRVCLPHKLAGVDVIWPFCVISTAGALVVITV